VNFSVSLLLSLLLLLLYLSRFAPVDIQSFSCSQAGLTIFGVVGGPLLGVFTLGMGTEVATESGAITGALTALSFLFWIAFGQPRPMPPTLPMSIEGCDANNLMNVTISVTRNITNFSK